MRPQPQRHSASRGEAGPPRGSERPGSAESRFARRLIVERRARDARLGAQLFGEPGWDMLLEMFAAHEERKTHCTTSICVAAAVAPSTALRCLSRLVADGLIVRVPDPADRHTTIVKLTPRAIEELRRLLQSWMRERG